MDAAGFGFGCGAARYRQGTKYTESAAVFCEVKGKIILNISSFPHNSNHQMSAPRLCIHACLLEQFEVTSNFMHLWNAKCYQSLLDPRTVFMINGASTFLPTTEPELIKRRHHFYAGLTNQCRSKQNPTIKSVTFIHKWHRPSYLRNVIPPVMRLLHSCQCPLTIQLAQFDLSKFPQFFVEYNTTSSSLR